MHKLIPIVLVLLITIPFAFSSTDLTLNLDSNQIGINQVFSGTLDIDLDDSIDSNSLIDFYINDNFAYAVSLKDALKGQSISITKESYKDTNTNVNSVDYDFERAGKLINAALKFDDNANKLTITNNLSFKIEGINNPDQVSIDLNNDGIIDYTYKGELINKFEDLDKSNLAGKTEPESYTSIEAEGLSSYCVETIVKPSSSYKIITIAKKGEGWSSSVPLSGTISDTLLSSPSCGSDDTGCCTFSQKTSSQEVSCNLKKIYDSEQKVYLCLFVLTGNMDELPFEIGYFKDSSVKKSYINGKLTDKNFFIYGQRQLFNTVLNTKVEVQKEYVELKKILNTSSPTLPIAVYSKSAGIVRLSDVKFQYKTDVPITLSTFTKLTYTPELINNKTISIQLNKLLNLTSTEISEDSEIYAVFNGETSNTENFDVVEGARLLIQKTTENAYLGQNVEFAAHSDEDITYAVWDFGDNATATGEKVSHIYSKEGTYTVSLTVRDDLNISSTASTIISVANLKDSLVFLVTDTYERLKSINEKIASSSDKEVLSYLDLVNQMQGFSANLTLINNSVISTLSGNLTGTALDTKLMSIKTQLDDIRSKLITDFSVSSVSFTPKAYDSSQIPSSVTLGRDEDQFQERVLKAQESASVSGIVYTLTLSHLGSESKQVIVKKTASGGGKYYELIQSTSTITPLTKMNYKVLIPGVYEVTSFPFVYSIENLDSALASSTIVVPTDLPSLTTSGTEIITTGVCGDGLCDTSSESSSNCPEDCTSNRPWWVIIVLILVLAAGLFVIYYFKDKLFVQRSKPVSTKIFTNERDYQNIKRYVESSLRKGFTDMQIELALRKQGWKQNQISYILTEVKGSLKRK